MTSSAIVIAHRGASGYLPEHTLLAKALAYGLRADYLEQDVVATRDGRLVVLHDLYLDDVTDVAMRYPERRREDGHYYVIDFDLVELETLSVLERRAATGAGAKYPTRFPREAGLAGIATLEAELRLVQGLNKSMGRAVGVYPEIKHPDWHRRQGVDLTRLLLAELAAFGYSRPEDRVFVQCFDAAELKRVRHELGCGLPLIQLVEPGPRHAALLTAEGLRGLTQYATGLGSHYSQLIEAQAGRPRVAPLANVARDCGLALHAYTFRRDELPAYVNTLEELLEFAFVEARVDGVFCDHPDVAVRVRDRVAKVQ